MSGSFRLADIWPRRFALAALIGLIVSRAISVAGAENVTAKISFDIPSQPLADALVAFSARTGFEVFYDGALSVGRRSTALKGEFEPLAGLQILLRGTNNVSRTIADTNGMAIMISPAAHAAPAVASYEPYFALLQAQLGAVLCAVDAGAAGRDRVVFNFWLDPSGVISRATVFGLSAHPERRDAISAAVRGLRISEPPPAGMPQPVTMAIFPASASEATGCGSPGQRRTSR